MKKPKKRKGKPQPDLMRQVRAARCLVNDSDMASDELALQAFMGIFHPNYDEQQVRSMVEDVRQRRRNRGL